MKRKVGNEEGNKDDNSKKERESSQSMAIVPHGQGNDGSHSPNKTESLHQKLKTYNKDKGYEHEHMRSKCGLSFNRLATAITTLGLESEAFDTADKMDHIETVMSCVGNVVEGSQEYKILKKTLEDTGIQKNNTGLFCLLVYNLISVGEGGQGNKNIVQAYKTKIKENVLVLKQIAESFTDKSGARENFLFSDFRAAPTFHLTQEEMDNTSLWDIICTYAKKDESTTCFLLRPHDKAGDTVTTREFHNVFLPRRVKSMSWDVHQTEKGVTNRLQESASPRSINQVLQHSGRRIEDCRKALDGEGSFEALTFREEEAQMDFSGKGFRWKMQTLDPLLQGEHFSGFTFEGGQGGAMPLFRIEDGGLGAAYRALYGSKETTRIFWYAVPWDALGDQAEECVLKMYNDFESGHCRDPRVVFKHCMDRVSYIEQQQGDIVAFLPGTLYGRIHHDGFALLESTYYAGETYLDQLDALDKKLVSFRHLSHCRIYNLRAHARNVMRPFPTVSPAPRPPFSTHTHRHTHTHTE